MERKAVYGVLNVVAHPHPEGTYRKLFEVAGADSFGHQFFGDRFATLSPITETRKGVFSGRLATWTEIDEGSNLIDKTSLKESLLADAEIPLPENVGFNSKVFSFAFREADHKLFVELKNDEGQSISIGRARTAFDKILQAVRPLEIAELDIHTVSRKNAVEQVLSIPHLRKIEIVLDLPNPDDTTPSQQQVIDKINSMNAKRLKTELTKSSGADTLVLTPDYLVMSEIAKDNGHVVGHGRNNQGETIKRDTNEYPQEIDLVLMQEESSAIGTRRVAETHDPGE